MRKLRNSDKFMDEANGTAAQTFMGVSLADELEIPGVDNMSGAYASDSTKLEHPSEASGVIVVGGSMPEVEIEDSGANVQPAASAAKAPAAPSQNASPAHSHAVHQPQARKAEHSHAPRKSGEERRKRRRALISAPVRVRPAHITDDGPTEVTTTVDVSRSGILFLSDLKSYKAGMEVAVVFPYSAIPGDVYAEQIGHVVRHVTLADGRMGVAVTFEKPAVVGDDALVDSGGRSFLHPNQAVEATQVSPAAMADVLAPVEQGRAKILVVESDERARQTMCSFLSNDGYNAMGVGSAAAAREILADTVPAVVVAEIEGEGMEGYDLCTSIKRDERLARVPVILTTRSAYPSDYANAHAVGAIICMAKPFKQEKLGHMVRLLAPLRKKAHEELAQSESSHGKARKHSGARGTQKKASYNPDEFKKLCDDAVREKNMRDNGRYDCSDTATDVPLQTKEVKPQPEQRNGFASKFASLFKR